MRLSDWKTLKEGDVVRNAKTNALYMVIKVIDNTSVIFFWRLGTTVKSFAPEDWVFVIREKAIW